MIAGKVALRCQHFEITSWRIINASMNGNMVLPKHRSHMKTADLMKLTVNRVKQNTEVKEN
jgi:hypothetical protein